MQKNDTYEFRSYTATIIESNTWSETHVTGNTYASSAIRSHSRRRQTVWLRDDLDGKEFETEITQAKLSCRVGHKLLFIHAKALRKKDDKHEKLVALKNLNTGEVYQDYDAHGSVIRNVVPFSIMTLLLWIFLLFVANLDVLELYSGLLFTIAMATPLIISYFRHRAPRLLFDHILEEKLAEFDGTHVGAETVNVSGAMA